MYRKLIDIPATLYNLAAHYGYSGVFVSSLLGSLIPFLPLPYLIIVILLSGRLDPLMLGVVAGIGGSLGKITSYALGRSGYVFFKPKTKRNMAALRDLIGKYGTIGVFIFAITPLPDDIYLIPIGMMKFSFWRFFFANTLGKIILSVGMAYFGRSYFQVASYFIGGSNLTLAMIVLIPVLIAVTVVLLRIDWELVVATVRSSTGWRGVFSNLPEVLSLKKQRDRQLDREREQD